MLRRGVSGALQDCGGYSGKCGPSVSADEFDVVNIREKPEKAPFDTYRTFGAASTV